MGTGSESSEETLAGLAEAEVKLGSRYRPWWVLMSPLGFMMRNEKGRRKGGSGRT